jgi:hypothetical protein
MQSLLVAVAVVVVVAHHLAVAAEQVVTLLAGLIFQTLQLLEVAALLLQRQLALLVVNHYME